MSSMIAFRRALLLLVVVLGCSHRQVPERPILNPQSFPQRIMQLPSGLKVLVQEDHHAPLVAVVAVVGAGSVADPQGQEGLAHLVEHLAYRRIDDRLRRLGATYNATTEPDRTTFFTLAHRDQLEELLAIEGARLAEPLAGVTDAVLAVERDVVRNELYQRGRDPHVVAELFKAAFPGGHPLARVPDPAVAPLSAITLDSAQKFVDYNYQPENITLVIAGDVDGQKVSQLIGKWDARITSAARGGASARRPAVTIDAQSFALPAPRSTALQRLARAIPGRRLVLAWSAPPNAHDGDPFMLAALQALTIKLNSGHTVIASRAIPNLFSSPAGSLFTIEMGLRADEDAAKVRDTLLGNVSDAMGDALARFLIGRVNWATAAELMRGSNNLLGSTISVAHYLAATGRSSYYRDTLQALAQVRPLHLSEFLWKTVSRPRVVSFLVEPERAGVVDADEVDTALLPRNAPHTHDVHATEAVSLAGMGQAELLAMVRSPGLAGLPRFQLANGLKVVTIPRPPGAAVAELTVQLPHTDADLVPYGLTSLAGHLSEGQCEEESFLLEVGGNSDSEHGVLGHRHTAQVFAGNLANALADVSNEVRCREVSAIAGVALKGLRQSAASIKRPPTVPHQARSTFWALLYPDGAFGLQNAGANLAGITEEDLAVAVRAQYTPDRSLAVVVTDVPQPQLMPLVEQHLGSWEPQPRPALRVPQRAIAVPEKRVVRLFGASRAAQAMLRFGCRLPPATEANLPAYDLLEAVVRRDTDQVRQSWGATYGLEVDVVHRPHGIAHLTVQGAVDPAQIGKAIARLLALVRQLATNGPDIKTFTLERWNLGREFNLRFATPGGLTEGVLSAARAGWSTTVWDEYPANLARLSRGSLRDLLGACADREVVTVLGDPTAVATQLQEYGVMP